MKRITCSECRFWEKDAHECRRNAPLDEWPSTAGEDWCGDAELPEAEAKAGDGHDCPSCGAWVYGASAANVRCSACQIEGKAAPQAEDPAMAEAEAQPGIVVPTAEPAPAKPKFKVGQWVKCGSGCVGVIEEMPGDRHDVYVRIGVDRGGWTLTDALTPCPPDPRVRWPNGPPWPGQKVKVVEHPANGEGIPYGSDEIGCPSYRRDDFMRMFIVRRMDHFNGVVVVQPDHAYGRWHLLHNCEPFAESET